MNPCTEFKNLNNIYDLMALACQHLLQSVDNDINKFFEYTGINTGVNTYIQIYIDTYDSYGNEYALKNLLNQIEKLIMSQVEKTNFILAELIYTIDSLISYSDYEISISKDEFKFYKSLNTQYYDQIVIIPIPDNTLLTQGNMIYEEESVDCFPLLRNRKKGHITELDKWVNNYLIFCKSDIIRYNIDIFKLNKSSHLGKCFANKKTFSIGIVPFIYEDIHKILEFQFNPSIEKDTEFVRVNKMYDDACKRLTSRYLEIIKAYQESSVDFIIFPEMLFDYSFIRELRNSNIYKSASNIIINGTIWEAFSNRCIITNSLGHEICTYYKQVPYEEKNKQNKKRYIEDIRPNPNKNHYCLIDIEDYGRIGFAICKDLDAFSQLLFPKITCTDFFLVPSYTKSLDLKSALEDLSKNSTIITVLCNSCSTFWKDNKNLSDNTEIGLCTLPSKKSSDRDSVSVYYRTIEDCKSCCDTCNGFIFEIDFSKIINENNTLTYKHTLKPFKKRGAE